MIRWKPNPNMRDGQCMVHRPGKTRAWIGPVKHMPKPLRDGDIVTLSTGDYMRAMQAVEFAKSKALKAALDAAPKPASPTMTALMMEDAHEQRETPEPASGGLSTPVPGDGGAGEREQETGGGEPTPAGHSQGDAGH